MKVYLIGYMGVGKSTVGKRLAKHMNFTYSDLDLLIEKTQSRSISSLFEEVGEECFREIERDALLNALDDKTIISTGGGAPCYKNNMDEMLKNGIVVWLKMPPKALLSRLKPGKGKRPLIANLSDTELEGFIEKHLNEREMIYRKADIHFDAININQERIEELILQIRNHSK